MKYDQNKKPKPKKDHKPKGQGKGQGKGKGKGKGQGKPKGRGESDLYEPSALLRQKSLRKGARALTRMELGPQIGAYKRLSEQLERQKGAEAQGLEGLGNRTAGAVSDVYKNLAQSQAENVARQQGIGNQLVQRTQESGDKADAALTEAQGLVSPPGSGEAQARLTNMVASQKQRQAQVNQAQQNLAASQASSYGQLSSAQAAAEQSRGSEAQRDIRTGITSRIAESNLKHNLDISEAQGKLAETRALRGPTRTKNLLDLREKERDFSLGLAATRTDMAQMRQDAKQAGADRAFDAGENAKDRKAQNWRDENEEGTGGGDRKKAKQDRRKDVGNIRSAAVNSAKLAGGWPDTPQEIAAMVEDVRSKVGGADIALVRKIVKNLAKRRG